MIVLGFTGTFAAGKDTVISIVASKFPNKSLEVSTSNLVREETAKRNLPLTRDNFFAVANDMRLRFGGGIFGQMTVDRIREHPEKSVFLVSGIRSIGEVETLRQAFGKNFKLIAVDAPIELRYKRIQARDREGEHVLTFAEFKASQEKELKGEAHSQNISAVMKMADYTIQNSGSAAELEEKVEEMLGKVVKLF